MFCIKCGQDLPDNAMFCSNCGAKTLSESNLLLEKEMGYHKNNTENEEVQTAKIQAEKERQEILEKSNNETRKLLSDAVESAKEAKTTRIAILLTIAGASALIALISFSAIFTEHQLTEGWVITLFLSFSVAVGVLCGTGITCQQFNQIIREKEMELKRFEEELETSMI